LFEKEDPQDPLRDLTRAIRRLAAAGSGQAVLFPDDNASAMDLVRDFDQQASLVREEYEAQLSPPQIEALNLLQQKLSTISSDGAEFDADIWTDEAVRTSERWSEVRELAISALQAFSADAE
jgi:hypothetical protein